MNHSLAMQRSGRQIVSVPFNRSTHHYCDDVDDDESEMMI